MEEETQQIIEQVKYIKRFSAIERLDELKRISLSDKGTSSFDGWSYLDKRKKELEKELEV